MKHHPFTLIEVVIALAILSLSLAGMFRLMGHSLKRISSAEDEWQEMHNLTQAAEYLLLTGSEEDLTVPDEVFPYQKYLIDCVWKKWSNFPSRMLFTTY